MAKFVYKHALDPTNVSEYKQNMRPTHTGDFIYRTVSVSLYMPSNTYMAVQRTAGT
jgi:hypothetical protein